LDLDLRGQQIGGDRVDQEIQRVSDWFESFSHWLWVLTSQSLDPVNPDPKVIHRRSTNIVVTASARGQCSIPASGSPTIRANLNITGPTAERLVNGAVLDFAVQAAGKRPPLTFELLASSRMAARRNDYRRALIDAGTAAEAALSAKLGLPPNHKLTLGNLVKEAQRHKLAIPRDTMASLVEPRNKAVHRGVVPGGIVDRALDVAEDLVALVKPRLIRIGSLTPVNRPQWNEIRMILGKRDDSPRGNTEK
jgi:hypothetical protein